MPNDPINSIGQAVARDSGKPEAPRQSAPVPEVTASTSSATQAGPNQATAPSADAELVRKATEQINKFIQSSSRNLQFSVDQNQNRIIVKVVDKETGEVIRQIPGEETLAIASSLDTAKGVLIQSKA
ncbi:MAG: flagellar protein FlaG [Burkholderiales bacterium]|nr:flagellar protein FlaG [Burkholderiales bacterium]